MKRSIVLVKAVLLVLIALGWYGCGGGSSGLNDNKGGSTLTLTANPTSVKADGISFSTITAVLTDNTGKPAAQGTQVDFTTTLGLFANGANHFQTVTDATGTAVAILYAGSVAGDVQVQCSAGGLVAYVKLNFSSQGGATLSLTANPTSVKADGVSFSTITAVLTDKTGKPAVQGTQVDFTTTLGLFANNSTRFQALTDANGTAVAILYAGTAVGDVQVQCSAGGLVAYVKLNFSSQGGATLKLTANPTSINADGVSFSAITAVLTDSTGGPPKQRTSVEFTTNLGTFANGSTRFQTETDATGTATAILYAGTTPGDVTVQCSAGGLVAFTYLKFVNTTSGPTASITLSVSNTSIIADGISTSVITAILKDKNGLSVAIGTSAGFATNLAVFSNNKNSYSTTTVDEKGTATATLIAGLTPGTATVTCTSGSVSAIVKIEIRSF